MVGATVALVEVVVVGKAAVAVEEAEEMAAPAAVVALVSSFLGGSLFLVKVNANSSLRMKPALSRNRTVQGKNRHPHEMKKLT